MIRALHQYSIALVGLHMVEVEVSSKPGVNEFDKGRQFDSSSENHSQLRWIFRYFRPIADLRYCILLKSFLNTDL